MSLLPPISVEVEGCTEPTDPPWNWARLCPIVAAPGLGGYQVSSW